MDVCVLILYLTALLNSLINDFFVMWFSMYNSMSSVNRDNLTSSFLIWTCFMYLLLFFKCPVCSVQFSHSIIPDFFSHLNHHLCDSMDCQGSLSINISQSLLKLMSIESVMPSNHLKLCPPLLLLPSIFPNIRVFSNESVLHIRWPKYWNFSFIISPSMKTQD